MKPVHRQRAALCDLLESLTDEQWQAETMCDGWDAGDIAAHLLVREREPWAAGGILIKPLASLTESRMRSRTRDGRAAMIADLRKGPPPWFAYGPLARAQVAEDYIHTEDVRRGGAAALTPRLEPDDGTGDEIIADILWESVSRFAVLTFGRVRADGVLALTDGSTSRAYTLGGKIAHRAGDARPDETVTVHGPVGDLLLYTTGRVGARVSAEGPQHLIDAIEASHQRV
ncbi:maleylpyruvate isomerase family mycothiol-dependent enzyme [Euzebya sp.]|uniref:maleylpyruvate isomerase family mycothiol-dependent enzyme n=1 Tax=Euzebya sp. TaxID=1971409 RepID=UPI0035159666